MALVMDAKRAYVLLEIAYNEPIDKIKRAFKKLALKKHPDKNKNDPNANEKYMELQEAYKYLSNLKQDTNPNSNNNRTASESVLEQAQPNEFELKLTLEEIFRGCVKNPKITRKFLKNGQVKEEEKTLQVKISPGIATGARITVDKAGDSHIGRIPANVVFVVKEEPHQYFRRSRFHLEYTARLTSAEACIGHVQIPTLENALVPLEVDELITPNTVKRITERGLPHPSGNGPRGDIIVMFEIIYDSDKPQDPPMELDLLLTLEQILRGCTKNVKISRSIIDINGDERLEDVILTVDVQPGTEEGTKFKFVQKGDKRPETIPADIVFTTRDKPHPYFRRSDSDVEHTIMITTQEAQTSGGLTFEVPTLESEKLNIELRGPITYGTNKKFIGYGLPYVDQPEKRGDLIVRFDIVKNDCIQPPMEYDLKLSLENILKGCTKRMKITRKIFDSDGNQMIDDKIVTIDVQPGTVAGTRYRFAREGDRLPGSIPADIVFIACDKPHDTFVRNGAHLEYVARMTHSTFSTGGDYKIPTLEDGIEENLKLDNIVKPTKTIRRFSGRGLPYENSPDIRGDLIVTLEIIENPQDPPLIHDLYLPAEQMRSGITKKLRITRRIIDIDGNEQSEGKVLAVEVAPKTVDGTKIVFPQIGDVRPGKIPSDVIFVIKSKLQDPPVERDIYIPLENILNGCTKRLKIKRLIANDEGEEEEEEKIVTLNIKQGVEEGTKFTFPKEGDQIDRHRIPADVVFRVHSKEHDFLKRNGVDLEYVAKINRSDSINEAMLLIPNLDDENVMLKVDDQIGNGTVRRIRGKGLPFPNNANRRGDLVVRFEIENDDDDESSDSEIYFA